MPFSSPYTIDIPYQSLPSYVFTSPTAKLSDQPLFVDADSPDDNYLTFSAYRLWSQRLAAGLRKRGFRPGQRLLVYSLNSIYYPVAIMGTIMAGGVFTGSSPGYTVRELKHHWSDSEPSFILCFPEGLERGLDAANEAKIPTDRIYIFDGKLKAEKKYDRPHWSELLASEEEGRAFTWDPCEGQKAAETTIALNYSSGTTGMPKGVEITHRNVITNVMQFKDENDRRPDPVTDDSTHLCFLPLNHAMAQVMLCYGAPLWGGKVYVQPKFDFMGMLQAIQRFRINNLIMVPPIIVAMSKHPLLRSGKIDMSFVKTVGTGAAPVSAETLASFQSLFKQEPRVNVRNGYGQSEATCGISPGVTDGSNAAEVRSVGRLLANMEAMVMTAGPDGKMTEVTGRGKPNDDAEGKPAAPRGELWVRGPNVMKGYWRRPDATADTITPDGWLKTGDVCVVDEEGYIYIVDRMKELIKVKGNQVAPAELEALLLEHPAVQDAAVIGVPTPEGDDERPRAYVQIKEDYLKDPSASDKEIARWVAERVNKNKRLEGGVLFMQEGIPKNPSGKILRKVLREMAAKERKAKL